MSSNKYTGGLTALLNRERERKTVPAEGAESAPKKSAESAPSANSALGANPALGANFTKQGVQNLHSADPAPSADSAPTPEKTGSADSAPSANSAPSHIIYVEPRDGYTAVPNTILDGLAARLSPTELSVYLRLYRLSHGFKKEECLVGYNALARSCNVSRRTAIDTVARLQDAGLVVRESADTGSKAGERANRYRVLLPRVIGAESAPSATFAPSEKSALGAKSAPNKVLKENIKERDKKAVSNPTVYEIRTIAARIREANVGNPSFRSDALRAAVKTVLLGEGREVDDATLDEAIRGMLAD